jgi:hypothetical protein
MSDFVTVVVEETLIEVDVVPSATETIVQVVVSSGPPGPSGTSMTSSEVLAKLMEADFSALPTSLPDTPGALWNNGGTPAIS